MVKVNRKEAEPMKEGYVDNRFASLYYKEMGQGMPLIMLHGNGESHEIFARLSELMSRYYRVILMDSRGHGSSLMKEEAAGGDLTIPDMAADVVQVMGISPMSPWAAWQLILGLQRRGKCGPGDSQLLSGACVRRGGGQRKCPAQRHERSLAYGGKNKIRPLARSGKGTAAPGRQGKGCEEPPAVRPYGQMAQAGQGEAVLYPGACPDSDGPQGHDPPPPLSVDGRTDS